MTLPGVCATGAKVSRSAGAGAMLCFVSPQAEYFWALVKFGEEVVGTGSRHGAGGPWRSQLSESESERCRALVNLLMEADGGVRHPISSEYTPPGCL